MEDSDRALPVWWSRDAIRWAACRPERWARPWWAGLALLAAAGAAVGYAVADSPGTPWLAGHLALAAAQLYGLFRFPALTVFSAPLLAGLAVWADAPAVYVPALLALAFGWASARHRTAVRRRQRLLAAGAAEGMRLAVPAGAVPTGPAALRLGLGARRARAAVPVLRVLVREASSRTWFYAGDDYTGQLPLFSCRLRPGGPPPAPGECPARYDDDRYDDVDLAPGLGPAVVFGALSEGRALVVLSVMGWARTSTVRKAPQR